MDCCQSGHSDDSWPPLGHRLFGHRMRTSTSREARSLLLEVEVSRKTGLRFVYNRTILRQFSGHA